MVQETRMYEHKIIYRSRLEIDFSSRGAILLPGVSICIALLGIEEQFL
jgi:hypothetical protein